MEFRRINALPPYVFSTIDTLKKDARRAGDDVIDLAFGTFYMPKDRVPDAYGVADPLPQSFGAQMLYPFRR